MVPSNPPTGIAVGEGSVVQPPITARPTIIALTFIKFQNDLCIVVSFLLY
jgi:hypothetical protein